MTPRPNQTSPLRKQTLLGMAPMTAPKSEPPPEPAPPREPDARQPIVPIAPAEAQIASTVRKNELRSSTLIGMAPVREPSEPPPSINAGPPSFASARDVALAVSETNSDVVSEPPPPSISAHPPSLASVRDVVQAVENEPAQSDAPPAKSEPPIGPTSRQTPAAAFARQAAPTSSEAPSKKPGEDRTASAREAAPAPKRSGLSIALLAAAGLVIGILGYRALHHEGPPPDLAAMPTASTLPTPAAASPSAQPVPEPTNAAQPAPSASAADFHAAPPAPLDSPTDAKPVASAEPVAAASAAPAGVTRVTITSSPPKAKFYHYGKEVGTAPFVVDLQPGEKHAYEVWLPGHVTRKVLVDGSKTELKVGLREQN